MCSHNGVYETYYHTNSITVPNEDIPCTVTLDDTHDHVNSINTPTEDISSTITPDTTNYYHVHAHRTSR